MNYFGFILFGVQSASWTFRLVSFAKLGTFQALFVQVNIFSLLSETLMTLTLNLLLMSPRPPRLSFFSVYFFFSVVQSGWFLLLYLHFYWFFPVISILHWSHVESLFQLFFSSKISIFCFIPFISFLRLILHLFQMCLRLLTEAFLW